MKSKTILGADGATKMRQITVGIHGKGGEAGISVEYQLRTGSVVMLPAYLHVEAIIKQRGGRNIEIKQENGVVNV